MTTEKFIEKATVKHGDMYDYSKVVYTKSTDKVVILCKIHGEFTQTPHKHTQGCGCQKCGIDVIRKKATGSLQNFLDRAVEKHGNTYDYTKVVYMSAKDKVTIICPTHGEFEQTPDSHTKGCGCPKCGLETTSKRMLGNRKISISDFIVRANTLHKNKYTYEKVRFEKTKDKVIITCKEHGDFTLSVNKHLLGHECPKCTMHGRVQNGWSTSTWEKAGKASSNFKAFSVYVIKCSSDTESFYKIGKTFKCINERIKKFKEVGYTVEIVDVYKGTAAEMSTKEKEMHKENKLNKYLPAKQFCGRQECYNEVVV
jgi:hypothetical protein